MVFRALTILTTALALQGAAAGAPFDIHRECERLLPGAVAAYTWFHQHPELSGKEQETARKLAGYLRELKMEVTAGIGGHGIVGVLRGRPGGKVVLYRADMDALPITEATGLPHASQNRGVMHACGHDSHMTVALGALRLLAANRDRWQGTVLFVGQPSEETVPSGALSMLKDRRFKAILNRVGRPAAALGIHVSTEEAAGEVALIPGHAGANVDDVEIVIHGKGGHASRPHDTIDPIIIGAETVLALQTIVSRRVPPGKRALVGVGVFESGTKENIVPDTARLSLTVRAYSDEIQRLLLQEVRRVAVNVARSHRAPRDPEVKVGTDRYPSGYNEPELARRLIGAFKRALGPKAVKSYEPGMGGGGLRFLRTGVEDPQRDVAARHGEQEGAEDPRGPPAGSALEQVRPAHQAFAPYGNHHRHHGGAGGALGSVRTGGSVRDQGHVAG